MLWSSMILISPARLTAYFLASLRRFSLRLISASFATSTSILERELEGGEERFGFLVGLRRRGDGNIHAPERIDLVVFDFRENDLLFDAHIVIAAAIERAGGNPAKISHARQRYRNKAIQKLIHPRGS